MELVFTKGWKNFTQFYILNVKFKTTKKCEYSYGYLHCLINLDTWIEYHHFWSSILEKSLTEIWLVELFGPYIFKPKCNSCKCGIVNLLELISDIIEHDINCY